MLHWSPIKPLIFARMSVTEKDEYCRKWRAELSMRHSLVAEQRRQRETEVSCPFQAGKRERYMLFRKKYDAINVYFDIVFVRGCVNCWSRRLHQSTLVQALGNNFHWPGFIITVIFINLCMHIELSHIWKECNIVAMWDETVIARYSATS